MVTVSCPGKLHLIGEYAVVDGHPAILAAVGLRYRATAEPAENVIVCDRNGCREWSVAETRQELGEFRGLWQKCSERKDFSEMSARLRELKAYWLLAAGTALDMLGVEGGVSLQLESAIPVGAGMGSSAAMAVAFAGAIAHCYGKDASLENINRIALATEQFFHGTPSGGDNSTATYGRLIWFRKAPAGPEIKPLGLEVPYELENFVAVDAGKRGKTTAELIQGVRRLDSAFVKERFELMGNGALAMREALKERDFGKVQALLALAQRTLKDIGVSTPRIDKIVEAVQAIGGAAKGCGAAGGGTVLCYHRDRAKLMETLRAAGFEPRPLMLAVEGFRVEGAVPAED